MKLEDYISPLDTQRFGFNIAKVNHFDTEPSTLINFLDQEDVKLTISKVGLDNLSLLNTLESLGFQIKDVQVTYKFDLNKQTLHAIEGNNDVGIETANPEDLLELQEIARNSFNNYGHYARSTQLDKQLCADIYADWIKNSVEKREVADLVLVAKVQNRIAGFLSFKIFSTETASYAAGGIGAVSADFRNKHIFRMISLEGLHWAKKLNLDWVEHNVLIDNYPVNQSFCKTGFTPYKSMATLHRWKSNNL